MQVAPARGNRQNGNLIIFYAEIPGDFFGHGRKRNQHGPPFFRAEGVGNPLYRKNKIEVCSHPQKKFLLRRSKESFSPSKFHPSLIFFEYYPPRRKKISNSLCLQKEQSNLHRRNHVPILISPRFSTLLRGQSVNRLGLTRRRGHVFDGNPA